MCWFIEILIILIIYISYQQVSLENDILDLSETTCINKGQKNCVETY